MPLFTLCLTRFDINFFPREVDSGSMFMHTMQARRAKRAKVGPLGKPYIMPEK